MNLILFLFTGIYIAAKLLIMRASSVLFVAFLWVLAGVEVDARCLPLEDKRRLIMAERQLLSEINTGAYNADAGTTTTDDDAANSNYNKYGNPSGSGSETHHRFTSDQKPIKI